MKSQRNKSGIISSITILVGCLLCEGAVTHVDPIDIIIPIDFGGVYLDLDSGATSTPTPGTQAPDDAFTVTYTEPADGTWDVNFFFGGAAMVHSDTFNAYRAGGGTDNLSAVHNVGLGEVIDGTPTTVSQPLASPSFGASGASPAAPHMGTGSPAFTSGDDGYIGFILNETSSPLYGWMLVELHDDGTPGLIKEWAYSDLPLSIGQVPEPSVSALVVIALAAAGLRRRRGTVPPAR